MVGRLLLILSTLHVLLRGVPILGTLHLSHLPLLPDHVLLKAFHLCDVGGEALELEAEHVADQCLHVDLRFQQGQVQALRS